MSFLNNIREGVRERMREFLKITEGSTVHGLNIEAGMTHETNTALHKILYRTDAFETEQAFKSLNFANMARFWSSVPSSGRKIRKIRSDLYQLIIDTYSDIVITSLNAPIFKDSQKEELFNTIFNSENEQNFWGLSKKAVIDCLKTGDGAFKISFDTDISEFPIVEFYDAEFVDFKYNRGRLQEIVFYNNFTENKTAYLLEEHYGKGYIKYKLFKGDREISLKSTALTESLADIEFAGNYIMAQQFKIWDSAKYKGRGKPFLDGKIDEVDALDEVISQWMDALRAGRVNKYIPETLIPRNEHGDLMKPNPFDNDFLKISGNMSEEAKDQITVTQPQILYDAFLQSYVASLDRFLMGIMSPSTLGIDARKLDDNATAQREREKITYWRKQQIQDVLIDVLPALINKVFKTYANFTGGIIEDVEVEFNFDEYNTPGIEQRIEVVAKAAPGVQILTWKQIAELTYPDLPEEEQEKIAEELKEINNPSIAEPAMFPNDFEKMEEIEE